MIIFDRFAKYKEKYIYSNFWICDAQNDRTGLTILRSTIPEPYPSRYGPICGFKVKMTKKNKKFAFWVWNMECQSDSGS